MAKEVVQQFPNRVHDDITSKIKHEFSNSVIN
jgi:hypothetical protein